MTVAFEFHPNVESVSDTIDEMIRDLELNKLRRDEMVKIFQMKLMELNNPTTTYSVNNNYDDKDKMDIIEMIFDYDEGKLMYKLNGKYYGENINSGLKDKYRLCVTFNGHQNDIELINYKQLK